MPIIHNPEEFWFSVAKGGVFAGLIGIAALNFASQHDKPVAPKPDDYFDAVIPEQEFMSRRVIENLIYQKLRTDAEYAEERVFFDVSPETVAACHSAVSKLAEVSIGPVVIDCTP